MKNNREFATSLTKVSMWKSEAAEVSLRGLSGLICAMREDSVVYKFFISVGEKNLHSYPHVENQNPLCQEKSVHIYFFFRIEKVWHQIKRGLHR